MAKYFPYLRGKTFELSAIEHSIPAFVKTGKILPIVEPVAIGIGLVRVRASVRWRNIDAGSGLKPINDSITVGINKVGREHKIA